jgi:hypothetical protein
MKEWNLPFQKRYLQNTTDRIVGKGIKEIYRNSVAYLLKARTVKPAETAVARQQIRDTQQSIDWEAVFSAGSM